MLITTLPRLRCGCYVRLRCTLRLPHVYRILRGLLHVVAFTARICWALRLLLFILRFYAGFTVTTYVVDCYTVRFDLLLFYPFCLLFVCPFAVTFVAITFTHARFARSTVWLIYARFCGFVYVCLHARTRYVYARAVAVYGCGTVYVVPRRLHVPFTVWFVTLIHHPSLITLPRFATLRLRLLPFVHAFTRCCWIYTFWLRTVLR